MSSALEQRFPDSVFLRNTKGERARFKKANLGNRNWAGWVHLQSYGKAPAVLVSDLKVGDYILYNYGYKSQVKSITPKGKASVVVETESAKDGKIYDRTYRLKSLIPILSDRQIQIHQRLKSKGYAAETFGADEEFYEEYPAKYYQTDEDEGVFYLPSTDSYWVVQGEDALTKEQSKELAFGAEAGTYRINWKDGKRGVTFDYEGGDDMHFDDTWTDLFWDASNPQVTEVPARKKRGLFRGKRGAESFNAVVVAPEQPKGSVEKALMNHYLFQESAMRQALMEIENRVDLGLMTAEEAERKLNRLIQHKMRSENYASENTSKKLLSGVFMLVAVASLWRAVTVTEDTYLFPKENKYMTILGSASIGLGILAWKGDSILAALED